MFLMRFSSHYYLGVARMNLSVKLELEDGSTKVMEFVQDEQVCDLLDSIQVHLMEKHEGKTKIYTRVLAGKDTAPGIYSHLRGLEKYIVRSCEMFKMALGEIDERQN